VTVEVEPDAELELEPGQLELTGAPGERVEVVLSVGNLGNVPVDIRHGYAFGVFAIGGLERALQRTFSAEPDAERGRADQLLDHVAEEHGGLVRVEIGDGAGMLAPGEFRDLTVHFRIPDAIDPARTYAGTWPFHDLRYYVRLIPRAKEHTEPAGRRKERR
jgi:hypothetical protein